MITRRVHDSAVATSAGNRRRWRAGGAIAHHPIDPRTGRPANAGVRQATALAPTAEEADVLAKVVFLLGPDDGAALLRQRDRAGVIVDDEGALTIIGDVEVERADA